MQELNIGNDLAIVQVILPGQSLEGSLWGLYHPTGDLLLVDIKGIRLLIPVDHKRYMKGFREEILSRVFPNTKIKMIKRLRAGVKYGDTFIFNNICEIPITYVRRINQQKIKNDLYPKDTDQVLEDLKKIKEDADVHGGDNASKEVEESPNSADDGSEDKKESDQKGENGEDGEGEPSNPDGENGEDGEGEPSNPDGENGEVSSESDDNSYIEPSEDSSTGYRGKPVDDKSLRFTKGIRAFNELMLNLVGDSQDPQFTERFSPAKYIQYRNEKRSIIPALHHHIELESKVKVLVTPDMSGSTVGWSSISQQLAKHFKKGISNADVTIIDNFNGYISNKGYHNTPSYNDTISTLSKYDIVLYLGDTDAEEILTSPEMAKVETQIICLDNSYSNVGDVRLVNQQNPNTIWINGVSVKRDNDLKKAARLVNKHLRK